MAVNFLTLRSAVANDMAVQHLTYSTMAGHPTASHQTVQAIMTSSIITSSHVGIGTTAPVAGTALNVVGSTMISGNVSIVGGATGDALRVNNSKTGNDNNASFILRNNMTPTPSQFGFILKTAGPSAYHTLVQTGDHLLLSFDQNNGVAGANGIVIGGWNQTAALRIGTTSSAFNGSLSVNGDVNIQGSNFYKYGSNVGYYATFIGGSATNSPYIEFFANNLRRLYIGYCNTTDAFIQGENGVQLNLATNGTTRLYLNTTGNVIIPSRECIVNQINGPGQFRAISGNYGFFIRNDGANTYFLLTASGDQYGSWNTLRPLRIEHTTGLVTMENGLAVNGISVNGVPITLTEVAQGSGGDFWWQNWGSPAGYYKLPGGMTFQWGKWGSSDGSYNYIRYPIAFTRIFGVQATKTGANSYAAVNVFGVTNTTCNIDSAHGTGGKSEVYWFAYGIV